MVNVAKRLRQWVVIPLYAGSSPVVYLLYETLKIKFFMDAEIEGFEPSHGGVKAHCRTTWRYLNFNT